MSRNFLCYNKNPLIRMEIQKPWRFKALDKKFYSEDMMLISKQDNSGKLSSTVCLYENAGKTIYAKRICVSDDENVLFIVDYIKSEEDICVYTDFTAVNDDMSMFCNVADNNRLVIRNSKSVVKHFRLFSQLDGCSLMDKSGLMMPQSVKKSGDVVYSMYEGLKNFGKERLTIFGFAAEHIDTISQWHFHKSDNGCIAEPPSKEGGWKLELKDKTVNIHNEMTSECVFSIKI